MLDGQKTEVDEVEPVYRRDNISGELIKNMSYAEWAAAKKAKLSQHRGGVFIPQAYDRNFDDCEPLQLTGTEETVLAALKKATHESNWEHGQIITDGIVGEMFTSKQYDRVNIPKDAIKHGSTLLHSHTNVTPLSLKDFAWLTDERIDKVGNIAYNGDVFMASIGNGWRPTLAEFDEARTRLWDEVNKTVIDDARLFEWTETECNYMAIREQAYRIAREFKWTLEGGRFDG